MTLIHISPGHSCCVASAPDDRETRWCFKCRKHLPHAWALMDDPPERQPSYYDAVPLLRCFQCRGDHTAFPGSCPDGPHYPESDAVWALLVERAQATRATWDWDEIWARDKERSDSFPRNQDTKEDR